MSWAGHVARMGAKRGGFIGSWWGNRRKRDQWGYLGVDGWIILGWIFRRWDVSIWIGLGWAGPGYRLLADACVCGNGLWGSVKCREFID